MPVKGYTFDIPTKTLTDKLHLSFRDIAFVATYIGDGKIRVAAFGDLSG